jgi:hypothetical protein
VLLAAADSGISFDLVDLRGLRLRKVELGEDDIL